MRIIRTDQVQPTDLNRMESDWSYNGMDTLLTFELLDTLLPQLDNTTATTYAFSRALQAPVLEMKLRGVRVDQARRQEVIDQFSDHLETLQRNLDRIVLDGVGMPAFNWRSNDNLRELFYDRLQIPEIRKQGRATTDADALEKIEQYEIAKPIVAHLRALKEIGKKIGVLKTAVDPDGRIRTSYNIAGTNTGRFSSSFTEFGTGGNLQNVEESLRSILIADHGYKFAKFDAKSGESFCVGAIEWNLFNSGTYLDACESGDPHTAVARICWPKLPWTGDLKTDKDLAERPYYRHHTYRFMCKKLGHGSNYGGAPQTLAQQSHLPINVVMFFQPLYFKSFPAHQDWQEWVREQIRVYGCLTSLMGRKRHFWGRRNEDATIREAIAFDPQSSLADIVNQAMLKIWRKGLALLMLQDHDALTFMYPEKDEDRIVPLLQQELTIPVPLANGRVLRIPYDAKVGFNRGDWNAETNPDGLKDYSGSDPRRRTPETPVMDRRVHLVHRKPPRAAAIPALGRDLSPRRGA